MGGWVIFAGIALAAGAGLWGLRFPAALKLSALAAAMLGAAGYAWQGNPDRAGAPVSARSADFAIDDETLALRNGMFGRYGKAASYLTPADAMMRHGSPAAAAKLLQGGINREPGNIALWTQLGTVIAIRDGDASPAALFAFRRAIMLSPRDPGPWFFLGLAQVRGGGFPAGRVSWTRALALTPANAPYREAIATRLGLLDYFIANMPPAR